MKRMTPVTFVSGTMFVGALALLFALGGLLLRTPATTQAQTTPTPATASAAMPTQQESSLTTMGDIQTTPTLAGNNGRGSGYDDDFYGIIDSRPAGTAGEWVISGRSFTATAGTELDADDGPLTVGACVSVDFEGNTAYEIESEPASDCAR